MDILCILVSQIAISVVGLCHVVRQQQQQLPVDDVHSSLAACHEVTGLRINSIMVHNERHSLT